MGLLDRWTKKQTKEQLAKDGPAVKPVKMPAPVKKEEVKKPAVEADYDYAQKPEAKTKDNSYNLRVIIRPLVTEKSAVNESKRKYTFIIARWAKKPQIKRAIKELYGETPEAVNIINVDGHTVRFGRNFGRRGDYKKALVTLPPGKTITIHEGV